MDISLKGTFISYKYAGDTNLYVQVLIDNLLAVCDGNLKKLQPVIFIQLDNTSATNKNNIEAAVAAYLVDRGISSEVMVYDV